MTDSFTIFADRKIEMFERELQAILNGKPDRFDNINSLVFFMVAEGARWRYETDQLAKGKTK